jgi:tetratricopeptide (TPR) repeat protein
MADEKEQEFERLNAVADQLYAAGNRQQAVLAAWRAARFAKDTLGDPFAYFDSLQRVGFLLAEIGQVQQAEQAYAAARELGRILQGQDRAYADVVASLAELAFQRGDNERALALQHEALEIRRAALPPGDPDVGASLNSTGGLTALAGQLSAAEPLLEEALAIRRAALGNNHPDRVATMLNLAGLLWEKNELEKSETLYREAVDVQRAASGVETPHLLKSLDALAAAYRARDKKHAAAAVMREALEFKRREGTDVIERTLELARLYVELVRWVTCD